MAAEPCDWQLRCTELKHRGSHLLQSGQWSDCSFLVGSEVVPVVVPGHKLILAMASPVFEAMFYGGMAERYEPIPILDVQPEAFKALLEYIYTDNINISSFDMACELYYGAKKYMLPHLVKECTQYLLSNLHPSNACRAYEFARLFDESVLIDKCIQIISTNTKEVLTDSSFEKVELNTVITVFSLKPLNVDSELDLFEAAVRYAKALDQRQPEQSPGPGGPKPTTTTEKHYTWREKGLPASYHYPYSPGKPFFPGVCGNLLFFPPKQQFTEMEDDKARSEATFRYTVQNFSTLKDSVWSPPCYVRNLPWKIGVLPKLRKLPKYLGFFLECNGESKSSSWSCWVMAELRLISHKPGCEPFFMKIKRLFDSDAKNLGYPAFMSWDDVLDPEKGYIKDDAITLEVHVTADAPHGVGYVDACPADKLTIRSAIERIRFLTLTSKQFAEGPARSSLLTESEAFAVFMNIASSRSDVAMPRGFSTCRVPRKRRVRNDAYKYF